MRKSSRQSFSHLPTLAESSTATSRSGSRRSLPGAVEHGPADASKMLVCLKEMKAAKDADGRLISKLFLQLPSRKLYPDYYTAISAPVSLKEIKDRVDKQEYPDLNNFKRDLSTLFSNAMTYNVEGSQVYADAMSLKAIAAKIVGPIALPKIAKSTSLPRRSSAAVSEPAPAVAVPAIKMIVKTSLSRDEKRELYQSIKHGDLKKFMTIIQLPYFNANELMEMELLGNTFQWGPLHCAAYYGRTRLIPALIDSGADVELADGWYGGTALAWAAFGDQHKAAAMLVNDFSANRDAKNSQGQMPFDLVSTPSDPAWFQVLTDVSLFIFIAANKY